jgi:VCBS repeat-containing protein
MKKDTQEIHVRGKVTENDEFSTVIGALNTNDDTARFEAQKKTEGVYGSFSIDTFGVWTYRLDNTKPNVKALNDGDRVNDTFKVTLGNAYGKTISTDVTIEILGKDESPEPVKPPFMIHNDMSTGVVTENEVMTAIGKMLTNKENAIFVKQTATRGIYGEFSITVDGYWTYKLYNDCMCVQELCSKDKRLEVFPVSAYDSENAKAFNNVKIVILGKDEKIPVEEQPLRII